MQAVEILLVEDSVSDVAATLEALESGRIPKHIQVVGDGEEALEYLYKRGRFRDVIKPDLILLDLNLPKIDGSEVLKIIKLDDDLRYIPVVILTTSNSLLDISDAYSSYANSFITKPTNPQDFLDVVRQLEEFWLKVVNLPAH